MQTITSHEIVTKVLAAKKSGKMRSSALTDMTSAQQRNHDKQTYVAMLNDETVLNDFDE